MLNKNILLIQFRKISHFGAALLPKISCYTQPISLFHSGSSSKAGFADFFDPKVSKEKDELFAGRGWTAADLRRKSFEDLHKLWYVLYKERNLLLTARLTAKRFSKPIIGEDEMRYISVKRSMAAIKLVLSERKKIAEILKNQDAPNNDRTSATP